MRLRRADQELEFVLESSSSPTSWGEDGVDSTAENSSAATAWKFWLLPSAAEGECDCAGPLVILCCEARWDKTESGYHSAGRRRRRRAGERDLLLIVPGEEAEGGAALVLLPGETLLLLPPSPFRCFEDELPGSAAEALLAGEALLPTTGEVAADASGAVFAFDGDPPRPADAFDPSAFV